MNTGANSILTNNSPLLRASLPNPCPTLTLTRHGLVSVLVEGGWLPAHVNDRVMKHLGITNKSRKTHLFTTDAVLAALAAPLDEASATSASE